MHVVALVKLGEAKPASTAHLARQHIRKHLRNQGCAARAKQLFKQLRGSLIAKQRPAIIAQQSQND
eukprot:4866386-Amphidinium_carterae.1